MFENFDFQNPRDLGTAAAGAAGVAALVYAYMLHDGKIEETEDTPDPMVVGALGLAALGVAGYLLYQKNQSSYSAMSSGSYMSLPAYG